MRAARTALRQTPGWNGRWSVVRTDLVLGSRISPEEQAREQARVLLRRYGIVAREVAKREAMLPWPLVAAELQSMELRGEIRRGYFVEGLSGMQFADPRAAEHLREPGDAGGQFLLNACDPANPYGPGTKLGTEGDSESFTRSAQNFLLLTQGAPTLLIENGGARLRLLQNSSEGDLNEGMRQLIQKGIPDIHVQYINGERPAGTRHEPVLRALGFHRDKDQTMRRSELL
jgi:ATP-dependent Lhr-like helicase